MSAGDGGARRPRFFSAFAGGFIRLRKERVFFPRLKNKREGAFLSAFVSINRLF
jgi:hypothetical protein